MPRYLDTLGKTSVAIAICDRCKFKFPIGELGRDPNFPGLRVCCDCTDKFDPWRLPAPGPDRINVQYPRPDDPLVDP